MKKSIRERVETLSGVPEEQLGQVVSDFTDSGAQVTFARQPEGLFQIKAVFTEVVEESLAANAAPNAPAREIVRQVR